jgi:hypothetical protein
MNLLENVLSVVNGSVGQQLASQFGVDTSQLSSLATAAVPVLASGSKDKLTSGNAGGLLDILKGSEVQQYAEDPAAITSPTAEATGENVLGQLFGGGNLLTSVISGISEKSGVNSGIVQRILPVLTSLFMGLLARQATTKDGQVDTGSLTNALTSLSGEHHGILDALKTAAGKIFG